MCTMFGMNALKQAIEIVGTQAAFARALGVKPQHVWNWINRDEKAPADQVLAIEAAVGGKVTRHDLRPDIFGPAPKSPRRATA